MILKRRTQRQQSQPQGNDALKILALSTAEQGGSLAVSNNGCLVCEEYWDAKITHSKRLVKMIDHMLGQRSDVSLEDIDLFVSAKGPGSFTGLRIGISVIKGLAYAMGSPAAGVSSLDGVAFRFAFSSVPVCVMMDAKRGEVYNSVYEFDHGNLVSKTTEKVVRPEEVIEQIDTAALYVGSGSKAYLELIKQKAKTPVFSHSFQDAVSAGALIRSLTSDKALLEQDKDTLVPVYIRKSDAQLKFAEKQGC